jgi:methionine aminopeptidase
MTHTALIARLAREYRLSSAVEDELTEMAKQGASVPDLAERALRTTATDPNRPPKQQQHISQPVSYSANDAAEVEFPEQNDAPPSFATRGNTEVLLP